MYLLYMHFPPTVGNARIQELQIELEYEVVLLIHTAQLSRAFQVARESTSPSPSSSAPCLPSFTHVPVPFTCSPVCPSARPHPSSTAHARPLVCWCAGVLAAGRYAARNRQKHCIRPMQYMCHVVYTAPWLDTCKNSVHGREMFRPDST